MAANFLDCQGFAALDAAAFNNVLPALCAHAGAKTVHSSAVPSLRLVRSFWHYSFLLQNYSLSCHNYPHISRTFPHINRLSA
jgi:hypothetical protein